MKNIILLIALVLIICGCKKESTRTYTIKGQFISCINGVETAQLKNEAIDLFQQNYGSDYKSKVLANTTTDAQGNFEFKFSTQNNNDKLIIRASSGYGFARYLEGIPVANLTGLKVYTPIFYNLVIGLNVTNTYTSIDTLNIVKADSVIIKKIAGPFSSGRILTWANFPLLQTKNYVYGQAQLKYSLNNNGLSVINYNIENSKLCGDTVYVNIDVK